jgi:Arc/MetJ-type ribon-helix-helix transcriptional regulator
MTSITIKLPEAMKEKLEAEAQIRGKSCSALIRDSLEKDLGESNSSRENGPSVLDLLQDLVGKGDSGIPDLATNPKYMKGFGEWRK